jgi:transcriptional regulator with XRE-family HTH domain
VYGGHSNVLFPERMKTLTEGRGMTKRDLAAAAGVSTARNAERGAPVGSKTARKVARALDVDPPQRLGRPSHLA